MPSGTMTCPAFAQKIATAGILEIQLGKVAQTNASLPATKKFAEKITPIIANHLKAAQKVQAQMQKDGLLP